MAKVLGIENKIDDIVGAMTKKAEEDRNSALYRNTKKLEKEYTKKKKLVEIKFKDTIIRTTKPEVWEKKIMRGEVY